MPYHSLSRLEHVIHLQCKMCSLGRLWKRGSGIRMMHGMHFSMSVMNQTCPSSLIAITACKQLPIDCDCGKMTMWTVIPVIPLKSGAYPSRAVTGASMLFREQMHCDTLHGPMIVSYCFEWRQVRGQRESMATKLKRVCKSERSLMHCRNRDICSISIRTMSISHAVRYNEESAVCRCFQ
jgi:hypothetical protein